MDIVSSYQALIQPSWAPPAWVFGPVWSVLYVLIAISFGAVLVMLIRGNIRFAVALPFLINIVANLLYTPIQFGLGNIPLATADILVVLGTLVWAIAAIRPHARWIAWMQAPYLLWVSFATCLQIAITALNA